MREKYLFLQKYLDVYEKVRDERDMNKITSMFLEAGFDSSDSLAAAMFIHKRHEAENER